MRQLVVFLTLAASLALYAGCDTGGSATEEGELEVSVATDSVALGGEGDTTTVEARVVEASTGNVVPDASIEWSSEDQSVATVSDEGLVRAQSAGETEIKASHDGDTERVFTEVIEITTTSKNTGNDGEVEENGDTYRFVDSSTENPVTDLKVSFLYSRHRTVLVAKDDQSNYPTIIKPVTSKKEYKKSKSSVLITLLMAKYTLDEILAVRSGKLPAGTLRWVIRNFYECNTGTILEVANNVEDFGTWPESAEKVALTFSFEGLAKLAEIAGTSSVSVVTSALSIRDIKSVIENRAKVWYFDRGYDDSSEFKYCVPDGITASQVFGDDMIIIPKKKPSQEATERGSLEGEITDKETGESLDGKIDLAGPSPRDASVNDGSFQFEDLIFGEYTLTATSTGYESKTVQVTIDGDVSGDVSLGKQSDGGGGGQDQIIAFSSTRDGNKEIYKMDGEGSNQVRLTDNSAADVRPAISPDGKEIVFASDRTGQWELFSVPSDGGSVTQLTDGLPANSEGVRGIDWNPDGSSLVFSLKDPSDSDSVWEIYKSDADGSNIEVLIDETVDGEELDANTPEYTPSGNRILMNRNVPFSGGTSEVWISDADGSNMTKLTDAPDVGGVTSAGESGNLKVVHDRESGDNGNRQIWKINTDGSNAVDLSDDSFVENQPQGPQGPNRDALENQFLFRSNRGGERTLWRMNLDGSNAQEITTTNINRGVYWWVGSN